MHTKLKFRCPNCDSPLLAGEGLAGCSFGCPKCAAKVTVPVSTALAPVEPQVIQAELVLDDMRPRRLARRKKRRRDDMRPVEMRLPGQLGGMKVDVDKKTSNAMATTFLGGLLVVVGAVLFSMFGGKKSA